MLKAREQRLSEWTLVTFPEFREPELKRCNNASLSSAGRALDDGDVRSIQRNIERTFLRRSGGSSERKFRGWREWLFLWAGLCMESASFQEYAEPRHGTATRCNHVPRSLAAVEALGITED